VHHPTTPSPYAEGTMVLLRSVAQCGGLDCRAYARLVQGTFGDGFEGYRNASITVRLGGAGQV